MITDEGKLKFSWKELFTSVEGRTSGSSFIGVISSIVCLILFCGVVVFYFFNTAESGVVLSLIDKITVYFGICAALLGVNKITSKFNNIGYTASNGVDTGETKSSKSKRGRRSHKDFEENAEYTE